MNKEIIELIGEVTIELIKLIAECVSAKQDADSSLNLHHMM